MKILINYIFILIISCSFSFFAQGQMLNLNFRNMIKERGLSSNSVLTLVDDMYGFMWFGTEAGLHRYNGHEMTLYRNIAGDTSSVCSNEIRKLQVDADRSLWVVTLHGIDNYNFSKNSFTHYLTGTSIDFTKIISIHRNQTSDVWLCSEKAVIHYNPQTDEYSIYHLPGIDERSDYTHNLNNNYVLQTTQGHEGNLWVATSNGLDKMVETNDVLKGEATFRYYKNEDGLVSDFIRSVSCDYLGSLWVSMSDGFAKFNKETNKFINFTSNNGVVSSTLDDSVILNTLSGEMMLGGVGFNLFHPKEVLENQHIPPVYITNIQIYGKSVPIGEIKDRKEPILKKSPWFTDEIELSYKENMIAFEFVALNKNPGKNEYKYILEGLEQDWNYTNAERWFASYSNLSPGEYVFRVTASNDHGIWNEAGTRLKIIIHPPFWNTWWFRSLSAMIIISIIIMLYRLRVRNIPVIMLTAKYGTKSNILGLQEGADDYMTKPFDPDLLKARVNKLIESRKRLRKRFSEDDFLRPRDITVTFTDEKFLAKAIDVVMEHMDDPEFNIDVLVSLMNMSRSSFFNKIKSLTDLCPKDFIQSIRLKRAKSLLKMGQLSISEVGYEVGYSSPDYFGKKFRKEFGMSPTQYRSCLDFFDENNKLQSMVEGKATNTS